jgi:CPA1 family monovalent cation:H+ antiporter
MRIAYIFPLLAAGIAVGLIVPGKLTDVFGAATLYVFLPALIFDGAWRLDAPAMRRMWRAIALLAIPGVLATAAIVAACTHYLGGIPWTAALLLGAILSATDPVAVLAIFRRSHLPRVLTTIVESEALLNDAVAVAIVRAVLAAAAVAASANLWHVTADALLSSLFGVLCGAALAFVCAWLGNTAAQPAGYAVLTFAGSYGSYYLAARFGWSGIFAVLAFGIALRACWQHRMGVSSSEFTGKIWDAVALAANAVLFFLIGAALDVGEIGRALPVSLLTAAVVLAARYAIVHGLLEFARPRLHVAWLTVVRLAGVRGALSLALALAIPAGFAQRQVVIDATFVVVVVTLLVALPLGRSGDVPVNGVQNDFG